MQDGTVDLASSDLEPLDVEVKEDIQEATRLAGEEPVVTFDKFTELMTAVLVSDATWQLFWFFKTRRQD